MILQFFLFFFTPLQSTLIQIKRMSLTLKLCGGMSSLSSVPLDQFPHFAALSYCSLSTWLYLLVSLQTQISQLLASRLGYLLFADAMARIDITRLYPTEQTLVPNSLLQQYTEAELFYAFRKFVYKDYKRCVVKSHTKFKATYPIIQLSGCQI